jgi:hypothetical protein
MQEATTTPATTAFQLLQLPDACLLAVLQRLAANTPGLYDGTWSDDTNHRSLFSAARAHSRLHAAAAAALSALQALVRNQQQADGALAYYLARHGQHVTSISFSVRWHFGAATIIRQLPSQCGQLRSLRFSGPMRLQLGASASHQGVLSACGAQLARLEVDRCRLLENGAAATATALTALKGLQHLQLRLSGATTSYQAGDGLHGEVWSALSRLTHLSLGSALSADDSAALEGISALTRLQELKLSQCSRRTVRPAVVSGLQRLTMLELIGGLLEPAALACVTQLRHLELVSTAVVPGGEAGVAALLAQLATMQQLTTICLNWVSLWQSPGNPPPSAAAEYSALAASSSLRQLDIWGANVPKGAWRHVFAGPRTALEQLKLGSEPEDEDCKMSSADIATLVDCCPRLQELSLPALEAGAQLWPLSRLVRLTILQVPDALIIHSKVGGDCTRHALCSGPGWTSVAPALGNLPMEAVKFWLPRCTVIPSQAPEGDPPDVWRQLLERLREGQSRQPGTG